MHRNSPSQSIDPLFLFRHDDADSRPKFVDILKLLNQPEFKVLTWSPEDLEAYDDEARRIGSSINNGINLYTDLQYTYQKDISSMVLFL